MTTTSIQTLLERNRTFAEDAGHEGASVLPNLRLFVIACIDPRVDPAHILGIRLSEALIARNVGGRVTPQMIDDIAFIGQIVEGMLPEGPLFEVAVIHHTQCGAAALADENFRTSYAARIGAEESALLELAVLDPAETVRGDVERVRAASSIPSRVAVSGHVYDVLTGIMQTVVAAEPAPVVPAG